MRRLATLVVPFLLLLMASVPALAQGATVGTATSAALGTYLTTPAGLPLYTFAGDTAGVSNVTGTLATVWPPFRATGALTLPAGVGGTLTQITRSDGTQQVAYNGRPLYTFVNDTTPGVVTGQGGAGGMFFVATAQGAAATATPSAAGTATPAATVTAAATAIVTATATPTALPVTGEPAVPMAPTLLVGVVIVGLGLFLHLRQAGVR